MFVFLCGINQSCHPICIYTSLNHIYGYALGEFMAIAICRAKKTASIKDATRTEKIWGD